MSTADSNGSQQRGADTGTHLAGAIEGICHRLPVRIYYEDTDFSGIVYHASYLRFMERGRSDFLRLAGVMHTALAAGETGEPLAFAVRAMTLDFLAPARIDDVVMVETRFSGLAGARLTLVQQVMLAGGPQAGRVLVSAEVTVVVITLEGRARRLPPAVRERLAAFLPPAG